MINMIRADWYRVFHGRIMKICSILTIAWVVLCAYAQQATAVIREALVDSKVTGNYWDSFFNYYPVILPIIVFCTYYTSTDFRQGTIKPYIAKGISRWKYYFSKVVIGWIAAEIFLLIAFMTGMVCCKLFWGSYFVGSFSEWDLAAFLLCQLLFHAAVATLVVSVTCWIKNSAICMVVNFVLVFFGYLCLHNLETVLGLNYEITVFWAFSNINKTKIDMASLWIPVAVIIFIGYLIVWGLISAVMLNKKDIA